MVEIVVVSICYQNRSAHPGEKRPLRTSATSQKRPVGAATDRTLTAGSKLQRAPRQRPRSSHARRRRVSSTTPFGFAVFARDLGGVETSRCFGAKDGEAQCARRTISKFQIRRTRSGSVRNFAPNLHPAILMGAGAAGARNPTPFSDAFTYEKGRYPPARNTVRRPGCSGGQQRWSDDDL